MEKCKVCGDQYEATELLPDGTCRHCARIGIFSKFARSCGLTRFPDPLGERYVYKLNGSIAGKKSECIHFMDELWNALVRATDGGKDLLI